MELIAQEVARWHTHANVPEPKIPSLWNTIRSWVAQVPQSFGEERDKIFQAIDIARLKREVNEKSNKRKPNKYKKKLKWMCSWMTFRKSPIRFPHPSFSATTTSWHQILSTTNIQVIEANTKLVGLVMMCDVQEQQIQFASSTTSTAATTFAHLIWRTTSMNMQVLKQTTPSIRTRHIKPSSSPFTFKVPTIVSAFFFSLFYLTTMNRLADQSRIGQFNARSEHFRFDEPLLLGNLVAGSGPFFAAGL